MALLGKTQGILTDLIAFSTVSCDSNLDLIAYLENHFRNLGARIHIWHDETGTKANLFASLGPDTEGGIVLSGHSDVVPVAGQSWSTDPFELHEMDGRWYGRGTCDMKGFLAAMVACANQFAELDLAVPVHFAVTYDEEIGCFGAQALAKSLRTAGLSPSMAIVGEPTSMRVVDGHKGCYEYTTEFIGCEGHGSAPDLGVNAVEYAVRYATRLLELKATLVQRAPQSSPFDPPWTSINTGALVGGVARNVIPAQARLDWEMRPVQPSDADFVKDNLESFTIRSLLPEMRSVFPEADVITTTIGEVEGLRPMQENRARDIVMELTGANRADVVPFGTEGGIFQTSGMDVVICGPGSIEQAHKANEYVSIDQMTQCLKMLEHLGRTLCR